MVVFEIAGRAWPLDDRTAEGLASAFRVDAARAARTEEATGAAYLADAIEAILVGSASGPIPVDEDAAEALFRRLNATIRNPDSIEPAYDLYLELRRVLGRLYS